MSVEKVANAYAAAFELNELDRVRAEYGGEHGLPPGFAEALLVQEKQAGLGEAVSAGGKWLAGHGTSMAAGARAAKNATPGVAEGLGRNVKHLLGTGLQHAGGAIAANPNAAIGGAAALGTVGAAGLGTGLAMRR